ncbi:hypothetical protein [Mycobacterium sp. AT1]|uniref:hypothetical protein n=1 Tax=Mycobacterium sp. AT1 TaxID=1961706 RepID=UPI00115496A2|nr:hypothetical protein [Mycobacterium sp. AT1]
MSGPRRRAAIAAAATRHARGVRVRVVDRAWTVARPTGKVTVCRTFDQLLDELTGRCVDRRVLRSVLLDAAGSVPTPS